MLFIKLIALAVVLVAFSMLGLGIKMLFKKGETLSGGTCHSSPELEEKGIGCGCGGGSCETVIK